MIELGISTFGETTPIEHTGEVLSHDQRIRNMIKEIELADQVGLDIYAVGEHHRKDFAVSAPEIILAAGAVNTKHIKLSSATTNISSNDPVRVFQNFATVDALSNGRAEIMLGRGSFIESFPLFGYNLEDYEELFNEKLAMMLELNKGEILTWKGDFTQTVDHRGVYPRPVNGKLPLWVATGGSPDSTLRIASLGLPIVYAIIGGNPMHFKPLIDYYHRVGKAYHHPAENLKVAAHSWGFVKENHEEAIEQYFYPTKTLTDQLAMERPHWQEMTKEQYLQAVSDEGAMFVGNVEHVANKIIRIMETLGLERFMLHLPVGSIPHEDTMHAIKLYGEEVAPRVRHYFEKKI
ncbi:LLM class flavin-dependent oxidoreductase [Enterococcus cecorum]|uniref:LLM class flavin-dependent oxidoreductase n=1 Tax=Enterococcus cecorum TaxID=44008 RepID=A0A1Y4R4A7_9ENTE|nr:LLM class flavin-dependent oxidoreductase [Enterococcus cecorum]OUQ11333.1 LLM class flavin-dependent oxidoreductase [Enterococcus cecorum]CAI3264667.1 LLM class flavin-dependent oxidoreductase [Enterococcus cecorum]CAI3388908.1 LLM class flavin-dependent oxidoreductase [Enterococcus cecorum]CAI3402473.1 LLM class flavin-dependent oxidoreductase [Enterococcus cecorum]CAI3403953.1 LLM class flavin-dependent oxidoreductase [Enterococcus cecorum]